MEKFTYKNNTYIRTPQGEYLIQGLNQNIQEDGTSILAPVTPVGHLSKVHPTMRATIHQAWLAHRDTNHKEQTP